MPLNAVESQILEDAIMRIFAEKIDKKEKVELFNLIVNDSLPTTQQTIDILKANPRVAPALSKATNINFDVRQDWELIATQMTMTAARSAVFEEMLPRFKRYPQFSPVRVAAILQFHQRLGALSQEIRNTLIYLREVYLGMLPIQKPIEGNAPRAFPTLSEIQLDMRKIIGASLFFLQPSSQTTASASSINPVLLIEANAGDKEAQFRVAQLFELGRDVPPNSVIANQWYLKAAKQGQKQAQLNLGINYFQGEGFPETNEVEAKRWLEAAAHDGSTTAKFNLAVFDLSCRVLPKNIPRAKALLAEVLQAPTNSYQGRARSMLDQLNSPEHSQGFMNFMHQAGHNRPNAVFSFVQQPNSAAGSPGRR